MKENIDNKITELYAQLNSTLSTLKSLTVEVKNTDLQTTVEDLMFHISSPFMFVIVGEVKAGKSSFINALLKAEKDICKVAPSPMTDTIQQIIYGETEKIESINPYLKRISFPEKILKEISIVDTPGTNTIIDHHQEITERFIPHADLIVFVFEAKNPYRQSAWEFFNYITEEWHKNVIFVLQQKDLMEPDDLVVNTFGVKEYAEKRGIENPNVFSVSAKMEQEKNEDSGYAPLRSYIKENILDGRGPILKLQSSLFTSEVINNKISNSLKLRIEQYNSDLAFREDIKNTLDKQQGKTERQVDILTENLIATYDKITTEKAETLSAGLSFIPVIKRSFSKMLGGDKSLKEWLSDQATDFELKLNSSLKSKLQTGIIDVADDIQMMGKLVSAKINDSRKILEDSDEIFSDIAEKRANVLADLQKSFGDFMNDSENFYDESLKTTSDSMAPNLAAGSGMAIIGVILSTAVNGAVFDITGGILTTVGVLFAGVSLGWKRRKVVAQFKEEIQKGRDRLSEDVTEKLKTYAARIKQRIDANFHNLDQLLSSEKEAIDSMQAKSKAIENSIKQISGSVKSM